MKNQIRYDLEELDKLSSTTLYMRSESMPMQPIPFGANPQGSDISSMIEGSTNSQNSIPTSQQVSAYEDMSNSGYGIKRSGLTKGDLSYLDLNMDPTPLNPGYDLYPTPSKPLGPYPRPPFPTPSKPLGPFPPWGPLIYI